MNGEVLVCAKLAFCILKLSYTTAFRRSSLIKRLGESKKIIFWDGPIVKTSLVKGAKSINN